MWLKQNVKSSEVYMHVKRQQQQQVFAAVTGLAGIKYISIHSCLSSTEKHSHPHE